MRLRRSVLQQWLPLMLAGVILAALLVGTAAVSFAADFGVGDTIEVYDTGSSGLVVRGSSPCGTQIGGKFDGDQGEVLEGPIFCDGYNRWLVEWEDGLVGWSAENWLREAQTAPPSAPTAQSPGSSSGPGEVINTLTPTLQWGDVSEADSYAVAISKHPYGSSNIIYNPQTVTDTSVTVPPGILEPGTKYRWNLQARNQGGLSPVSNTLYFQTETSTFDLTVNCNGSGSVSPQDCDTTQSYAQNTSVTLTASPDSDWQFDEWSGDCSGAGSCRVTMDEDQSVTANFSRETQETVTLTLYVHEGDEDGPIIQDARVTGQDANGASFDETTNNSGHVTISGTPGTWKFIASKSGYESVSWSQSITATVERHAFLQKEASSLFPAPSLNSPSNGEGNVPLKPDFEWSSVSGANGYWLMVATSLSDLPTDPDATSCEGCVIDQIVRDTDFTPSSDLDHNTTYHWQVQAFDDSEDPIRQGEYSDQWSFSMEATAEVTLTLYVHEESESGPIIEGVRVTGEDAKHVSFDETTNASGYVTITGAPGTWQFTASKSGYESVSWSQDITATEERHAFLQKEEQETTACDVPSDKFCAEYYNSRTLSGQPLIKSEIAIDHNWGIDGPGKGMGNDNFSVRWQGRFTFENKDYSFNTVSDDGIRLWIDDELLIDKWHDHAPTTYTATKSLTAGEHLVKVEYYERGGRAVARVRWEKEDRDVVFIQGIDSGSSCNDNNGNGLPDGFVERVDWIKTYLQSQSWVADHVNLRQTLYFSYTWPQGGYCSDGTTPQYQSLDTCFGVRFAAKKLRDFINTKASAKATIIGHSMGGLVASYLVATEQQDWVNSHIASVVTFDSPLRGLPAQNIGYLDKFSDCDLKNPEHLSLTDMLERNTVVNSTSIAAVRSPLYTIDAIGRDIPAIPTIEYVPGNRTRLPGEKIHLRSLDNHKKVWDRPRQAKQKFVGCAVIVAQSEAECIRAIR